MNSRCSSTVAADVALDIAAHVAADVAANQSSICKKMGGSNSNIVQPYHVWLHPIVIWYDHLTYNLSYPRLWLHPIVIWYDRITFKLSHPQ